ncbi:MAG: hypothetical protein LBQ90_08370 [Synergistaceae bacterium]|nr:hypothetical protein [Synergistaceae bacterium]
MRFLSAARALLLAVLVFVFAAEAQAAAVLNVTVTSPWLALLVNFIGGVNVKVTSIQEWNDDGELVRRIRARNLQSLPSDTPLIAFDFRDARGLGLPFEQYKNYRSLYAELPLAEDKIDASLSDPSVVPFIAQRVLTVLASWDPGNYPYYQRRLAELQARLYSSILAGRQMLKDQAVYDLTGYSNALLQAVGCRLVRPSPEEWAAWSEWKEISQLMAIVSRQAENRIAVVIDYSTPKAIRSSLASNPAVFLFGRPKIDQDYPAFLHDQYISLWSKITSRPLPPPTRRR